VDAVVNAANPSLAGGGGVDGAIHRAAGPRLLAACLEIVRRNGPLPTGRAVATPGFDLPAAHVIHTVGPIWRGGPTTSTRPPGLGLPRKPPRGHRHGVRSIAFPAISCGAYGFPVELAAPAALRTLRQGLMDALVAEAVMCLYSAQSLAVCA
jgi:O-acetyl-ADP-ribose deacetylase (regulator of RNase III)